MCPSGTTTISSSSRSEPGMVASLVQRSTASSATSILAFGRPSVSKKSACTKNSNSCSVRDDENDGACRQCGSYSLHVDWAQGDRVCTHCGVVAEEKLLDDRPEWREFNDADDLAKGLPAAARCGLVPVNESRYLGGLQPTTLAKIPFGGNYGPGQNAQQTSTLAKIRSRLLTTNRKLDHMMGQRHARALKNARVSRLIQQRQSKEAANGNDTCLAETDVSDLDSVVTADDDVRPELEQVLIQEEEDAHRMQAALNADKWSLRRAILLNGQHENTLDDSDMDASFLEREDLQKRLDSKLRKASSDLYRAYQMLLDSSRQLQLPDRVTHEATNMLCRYAARRDGFYVKGVSSRLNVKKNNLSQVQQKQAADRLREHNKLKQMGSLCAALLLLTARKLGWPRPLSEVCTSVQPSPTSNETSFIKAKHCSRAMDEVKSTFPDYARSIAATAAAVPQPDATNDEVSTIHFVDHAIDKLQLPPVAEASIRALVWHCKQEQRTIGQGSGTKLSTLCAAMTYFVCLAGSVMQQLASQAQSQEQQRQLQQSRQKRRAKFVFSSPAAPPYNGKLKAAKLNDMGPPPAKKPKVIAPTTNIAKTSFTDDDDVDDELSNGRVGKRNQVSDDDDNDSPFDVFSHRADAEMLQQKREYEMRRVWDAWAEQTSWLRSLSDVEHSSGISGNMILSYYKSNLFPRRQALLEWLRDIIQVDDDTNSSPNNILTETPMASVLLSHVVAAAPLLNFSGKQASYKQQD